MDQTIQRALAEEWGRRKMELWKREMMAFLPHANPGDEIKITDKDGVETVATVVSSQPQH